MILDHQDSTCISVAMSQMAHDDSHPAVSVAVSQTG